MSLWRDILGRFSRPKAASTTARSPASWLIEYYGGRESASGVMVSEGVAMSLSAYYCGVTMISSTIGALPLHVYRKDPTTRRRDIAEDHPAYFLLHDEPNPEMSAISLRRTWGKDIIAKGNAYGETVFDNRGNPSEIWPIPPDRMTLRRDDSGQLRYQITLPSGELRYLTPDRVIHVPGLGYDGRVGYGLIQLAVESIGLDAAQKGYASRFFRNGGNVSATLEVPRTLKEGQFQRLKKEIAEKFSGLTNAHRIAILEDGMKLNPLNPTHEEAQLLESRRFGIEEWARWLNIPVHKLKELSHATFCLPAGSLVSTEKGPKPIEEIAVGEKVWSRNEKGEWVKAFVSRSACTGEDEILCIRTTNRTLRANARHRILVRRKHAAPRPGKGGYQVIEWRTEYVPAGELRLGDLFVCADGFQSGGQTQTPTRQATVPFMEFCGLLLGDGNVYPGWGVCIARANDAPYMDHYRSVMRSEFRSYDNRNSRGNNAVFNLKPVHLSEGDRQTRFASVLAARELQRLGLCGTAHTKRVPDWVFSLTDDFRLAFLRGFLDADGSVDKLGRISFSSCNGVMLEQIRHLCMGCGIPVTNIRIQRGFTTLPNGKRHPIAQWTFTCSDPGANGRIGSNDPRYVERIAAGKPFSRKSRKYLWHGGRHFAADGCSLSKIVSIEVEPSEPVYDLEVEGTHSFVADGVVVHNSNIFQQNIEWVVDCLLPWCISFEQEFNRKLFRNRNLFYAKHNLEGLLRGDQKTRYEAYAIARNWGWMSANDVLELEDRNPLPGSIGDIYLIPANMMRADQPAAIQQAAAARLVNNEAHSLATKGAAQTYNDVFERRIQDMVGVSAEAARKYVQLAPRLNLFAVGREIPEDMLHAAKVSLLLQLASGGEPHAIPE